MVCGYGQTPGGCQRGTALYFKSQKPNGGFESTETCYENGIADYVKELAGEGPSLTGIQFWQGERSGRDREDKPDYKVKFRPRAASPIGSRSSNITITRAGLSMAVRQKRRSRAPLSPRSTPISKCRKIPQKREPISFQDVEDCLILVTSSFSSQTSYENQTKKAINNKFIAEA
jgi:DNA gyrase subunit B